MYGAKSDQTEEPEFDESINSWKEFLLQSKKQFDHLKKFRDPQSKEDDFKRIEIIGQGAFGDIYVVSRQDDKNIYAMKLVRHTERSCREKDIMKCLNFPFTVKLLFYFSDDNRLGFVLPLIEHGDLFTLLLKFGRLDERLTIFYSAQVLLALEYLHYNKIVYRDLKPENTLIDRFGFIKITDFGCSKEIRGRTYTFCGTPVYIAPEMLLSKGYGFTVDFWALGVFIYELCSGKTPFYADNNSQVFENISDGKYNLKSYFSNDLSSIIIVLLQPDTSKRYGNLKHGIEDIKNHKWFRKVSWMRLLNKNITPPYVPGRSIYI